MNPFAVRRQMGTRICAGPVYYNLGATLAGVIGLCCLAASGRAAPSGDIELPVLEFIQPTNLEVLGLDAEVPVILRAFAPYDVFPSAEVYANQHEIAMVSFCCALCPCAAPFDGEEMILQIPVPWADGTPPARMWQGWKADQAGVYRLTARATGQNSTSLDAAPVTITVVDRTLEIGWLGDDSVSLRIPQGSLVPGGYDLEASQDLQSWTRLGSFQPGDVAAFYHDLPRTNGMMRFYRSVYLPPTTPQRPTGHSGF